MNKEEEAEGGTVPKAEKGEGASASTSSAMYSSAAEDEDDDFDVGDQGGDEGGKEKNVNDAPKSNAESSNSDDSEQDQETVKPANNGKDDVFLIFRFPFFTRHQLASDVSDTAVSSRENLLEELSARLAAGEDIVGQALPDSSDSDCIDDANFPDVDDPQYSTMKRMEQVPQFHLYGHRI